MTRRPFYYRETSGIRITVRPAYLSRESRPTARQFVFAYFVRIENVGPETVQLVSRRWLIHDDAGEDTEVVGDGVVGQQPVLRSGAIHEYQSFCVLKAPSGWMEGHYRMVRPDGTGFDALIPRFRLATEEPAEPLH